MAWNKISLKWTTSISLQTEEQRVIFNRAYNRCINTIRMFQVSMNRLTVLPKNNPELRSFWDVDMQKKYVQLSNEYARLNNLAEILEFTKNAEYEFLGWSDELIRLHQPEPLLRFRKGPPAQPNKPNDIEKHRKT